MQEVKRGGGGGFEKALLNSGRQSATALPTRLLALTVQLIWSWTAKLQINGKKSNEGPFSTYLILWNVQIYSLSHAHLKKKSINKQTNILSVHILYEFVHAAKP